MVPVFLQGSLILFLDRWLPFLGEAILSRLGVRMQVREVPVARPLTHDLLRSIIGELGATVTHVLINDLRAVAHSTLTAIMGRMSAYTGRALTWQEALASNESLVPQNLSMDMTLPVPPVPIPGTR